MLVMPVVFSFIFGGLALSSEGNKPIVNIVVHNDGLNAKIVDLLKKNDQFEWKKVSLPQAKENVSGQDAIAAVVIPTNIQQRITDKQPLFDIILQRKSEGYLALSPYLQGTAELISSAHQAVLMQGSEEFPELLEVITVNKGAVVQQQTFQTDTSTAVEVNLMFVGFAIMFMMFGLSGAASVILDERMGGTWGRLMISPASKLQISLGYLISYFLMGWIQFAVLMVAMNLIFDATWGKLTYLIPFA
ncbi:MAG: ABC transporter permease, partial [Bacillus sp. (in: Bacteria)]|nr:ABC transporter permease [Bacillus sp. (in: firmicutes)]